MKKHLLLLTAFMVMGSLLCSTSWANGKKRKHHKWYEFWDWDDYWNGDNDHDEYNDDDHDHGREYYSRRFYEAHRISKLEARKIVSDSFSSWHVGEGWQRTKPEGLELIIPLEYKGQIIGEVKVDPGTGEIMPERAKLLAQQPKVSSAQARKIVQQALPKMIIGNNVRLGKHGNLWEVPLMFRGVEVEEINVGTGTGSILPDWHIEEEAYYYRQR